MTRRQNDLRLDIKIGKQIFENIPNEVRPGWSGFILSRFDTYINQIPLSILELYQIIDNKDRSRFNSLNVSSGKSLFKFKSSLSTNINTNCSPNFR